MFINSTQHYLAIEKAGQQESTLLKQFMLGLIAEMESDAQHKYILCSVNNRNDLPFGLSEVKLVFLRIAVSGYVVDRLHYTFTERERELSDQIDSLRSLWMNRAEKSPASSLWVDQESFDEPCLEITDALESLRDSNLSSDVELLRAYVEVIRTNGLTEPGDVWQKLADECIATISKVENAIQAANELMKNLSFCECPDVKFADIAAGTQKWKDLATEKVREMAERVAGAYLSN